MKINDHFRRLFSAHSYHGHDFDFDRREIYFSFYNKKSRFNVVKIQIDNFLNTYYPLSGERVVGKGPDGIPALFNKLSSPRGYIELAPYCFIHAKDMESAKQDYGTKGIRAYVSRKKEAREAALA